jgi:glycosyltransferase 2 family protein
LRRFILGLCKFALAFGLIFLLIRQGHLDPKVFAELLSVRLVLMGLAIIGIIIWLQVWRWRLLLQARGFTVSMTEAYRLFLIGSFFNYVLPGSVGGDLIKAFYIAQENRHRRLDAVLTVAVDRVLGLYAMVAVSVITFVVNIEVILSDSRLKALAVATTAVFFMMTVLALLAFSRRLSRLVPFERFLIRMPLGHRIVSSFRAVQAYGQAPGKMLGALLLSGFMQCLSVLFMMLIGSALQDPMPVGAYFFAVPLGFVASSLPVAPAGLGVGQLAFLVLFQIYSGRSSMLGQTAITAFQAAALVWSLPGAIFYLLRRNPAGQTKSVEA